MEYDSVIDSNGIGLGMDQEEIRYLDYNTLGWNRLEQDGIKQLGWNRLEQAGIK